MKENFKVPKTNKLADGLIERISSVLDEIESKLWITQRR